MHQGSFQTSRNPVAAKFAVLFFVLFLGSLTWLVASTAATPTSAEEDRNLPLTQASGKTKPSQVTGSQTTTPSTPAPTPIPTPGTGTGTDATPDSTGGVGPETGPTDGDPIDVTPNEDEPGFVDEAPDADADADLGTGDDPFAGLTVPNFVIENFEIPPFLLPIYQACGSEYGIPWYVLASINRAETNFGRDLSTSYAGAMGWMQFMPSSWAEWGVDANGDKIKDPNNPVDAICAAANYLQYFGYQDDPYKAIFAYNHADWYVQIILRYAKAYSKIPAEMISALTGLTEGARFPVASADASYDGAISTEAAKKSGTASQNVSHSANRRTIAITASGGSPVIAVNDGTIVEVDHDSGKVVLEDAYGNSYSYAGLGSVAKVHPVPQPQQTGTTVSDESDIGTPADDGAKDKPDAAAEMGEQKAAESKRNGQQSDSQAQAETSDPDLPSRDEQESISEVLVDPEAGAAAAAEASGEVESNPAVVSADQRREAQSELKSEPQVENRNSENSRGRVYASPLRPSNHQRASTDGQSVQNAVNRAQGIGIEGKPGDYLVYDGSKSGIYRFDPETTDLRNLEEGSRVIAGTVLGRLADTGSGSVNFSIKPGGKGTPQIDPKPFLDGWKLLADTNIYSAKGKDRFSNRLGVGGILLLSKSALQKRVLNNKKVEFTKQCDRDYIASGSIDRRLLATLEFVAAHGYSMLITSMYCGREGSITTSGNVSNHTRGSAVDIAAFNGEVVTSATQGPGSLTDQVARLVLRLQGTMAPDEVISLLSYPQPAGFAMGDHDDHLHVGFRPMAGADQPGGSIGSALGAEQWQQLTDRLGEISNPEVPTAPSQDSLPADKADGRSNSNQGQ